MKHNTLLKKYRVACPRLPWACFRGHPHAHGKRGHGTQMLLIVLLLLTGCQQKMADQPSYKELTPCDFFADGRSERPAVPGTVARGYLRSDVALWTGRRVGKNGEPMGVHDPDRRAAAAKFPEEAKARQRRYDDFVDTFPFP